MTTVEGKTVVVTGASAGLGAAAARRLAELGAKVVVVGRSAEKAAAVAEAAGADHYTVDYSSLGEVRELASVLLDRYPRIDVLANNAGSLFRHRVITGDGFEATMQVNYLAPFLLTQLLLDRLGEAPEARVITTASDAHRSGVIDLSDVDAQGRPFSTMRAYAASKMGNVLFTQELARRTEGTTITASCFHPGFVSSEMFRDTPAVRALASLAGRAFTPERGARPLVHLACVEDAASVNGRYFNQLKPAEPKRRYDTEFARRLWDRTVELLG